MDNKKSRELMRLAEELMKTAQDDFDFSKWKKVGWTDSIEARRWFDEGWTNPYEAIYWKREGWIDPIEARKYANGENNKDMENSPILHIDMTPDKNLAMRILKTYRQNCDCRWSDNTAGEEPKNALLRMMNKHQEERARILDEAIMILEANQAILDKLEKLEDIPFSKDEDSEWLLQSKMAKMIKSCRECPYINGCQDSCTLREGEVKLIPDIDSIPDWCPFKAKGMQHDGYAT